MRSTGTHMALTTTSIPTSSTSGGGSLDMASVMKAARVLAGEIVQERLLDALLRIALENAGATRGVLMLPREDGRWYVEAERDVHRPAPATPTPRPLEEVDALPLSIIHVVLRTGEGIFLEDATESPDFSHDPYVQSVGLRSALCLPARHRGQVRALLYLENRAVANVFHAQRREALTILTAQAAVSLENARLYANLEEKVRQRTEELAEKTGAWNKPRPKSWMESVMPSAFSAPSCPHPKNSPGPLPSISFSGDRGTSSPAISTGCTAGAPPGARHAGWPWRTVQAMAYRVR